MSSTGRKFSNYARSLDPTNIAYTVAELHGNNSETPYPSAQINSPPGGAINYSSSPAVGANYENYFIGVQSVVIDPLDRLWILDTGRAAMMNGTNVPASVGRPKLIGVELSPNQIIKTIVFPPNVAYLDIYINDIRFDLRASLPGTTGQGIGYMTDSSQEGRNGIIIVDLGSGESWRHLDGISQVRPEPGFLSFIWGRLSTRCQMDPMDPFPKIHSAQTVLRSALMEQRYTGAASVGGISTRFLRRGCWTGVGHPSCWRHRPLSRTARKAYLMDWKQIAMV